MDNELEKTEVIDNLENEKEKKRFFQRFKPQSYDFIMWLTIVGVMVITASLENREQFDYLTTTFAFFIITRILIALPLIVYAIVKKEETTILARITIIILSTYSLVCGLADSLQAFQIYAMVYLIVGGILTLATVFALRDKKGKLLYTCIALLMYIMLMNFKDTTQYTFENGNDSLNFWLAGLIVAVILTAITALLTFTGIIKLKNNKISEKISICFLVLMFSFIASNTLICNANYAFDNGPLEIEEQVIVEKRESKTSKSNNYYLIFEKDGQKIEISVPLYIFKKYEEGDSMKISYYKGFFNEPFYIYE
ncbi:MAG: hypothetical protein IJ400_04320 [Clostridia bacterium]|nr:hypothetical protein [Clostridia bacterium]